MIEQDEGYSWNQEFRDWEKRQDYYERIGLYNQEVNDKWEGGVLDEIQELLY